MTSPPDTLDALARVARASFDAYLEAVRGYAAGKVNATDLWRARVAHEAVVRDVEALGDEIHEARDRRRFRVIPGGMVG